MAAMAMQWCGKVARRFAVAGQFSVSSLAAEVAPILCGRGDKKTKKGKRFKGSYGNSRPKKEKMIQRIKDKWRFPGLLHGLSLSSSSNC